MLKGLDSEFCSLFNTQGRRVAGYPQVPLLPLKGILPALTTEEGRTHSTTVELLSLETGVQRASFTKVPSTGMHSLHRMRWVSTPQYVLSHDPNSQVPVVTWQLIDCRRQKVALRLSMKPET